MRLIDLSQCYDRHHVHVLKNLAFSVSFLPLSALTGKVHPKTENTLQSSGYFPLRIYLYLYVFLMHSYTYRGSHLILDIHLFFKITTQPMKTVIQDVLWLWEVKVYILNPFILSECFT